jgi:Zn-dependent protease/CBS domain-containing protein
LNGLTGNIRVASVLGIPIVVNVSWLLTLGFITTILALQVYPEVFDSRSRYRDDATLHWVMALTSGVSFFASILLHELAHSIVARRQGIPVKNITLFIFGGVSQIAGESKRPLYEFVMAIVGPLTSLLIAGVLYGAWLLLGESGNPAGIVLQWLFLMNLIVAAFNMAPGFPMDGGRVLRSILWGLSGNLYRSTRIATLVGRALGFSLMFAGGLAFLTLLRDIIDPISGAWFAILGLFLESSARQSWIQARALDVLSKVKAEEIMSPDLATARAADELRYLLSRVIGRRYIFFVADDDENVVGVLTHREAEPALADAGPHKTAADVMLSTREVLTAEPREDGVSLLQRMEAAALWHLPVVREGRVIGVVSKMSLQRLLERHLIPQSRLPTSQAGPAA